MNKTFDEYVTNLNALPEPRSFLIKAIYWEAMRGIVSADHVRALIGDHGLKFDDWVPNDKMVGDVFRTIKAEGMLSPLGTVKSVNPSRKGGYVGQFQLTDKGEQVARMYFKEKPEGRRGRLSFSTSQNRIVSASSNSRELL